MVRRVGCVLLSVVSVRGGAVSSCLAVSGVSCVECGGVGGQGPLVRVLDKCVDVVGGSGAAGILSVRWLSVVSGRGGSRGGWPPSVCGLCVVRDCVWMGLWGRARMAVGERMMAAAIGWKATLK